MVGEVIAWPSEGTTSESGLHLQAKEVIKSLDNLHRSIRLTVEVSLSFSDLTFRSYDDPLMLNLPCEQGPAIPFQSNLVDPVHP